MNEATPLRRLATTRSALLPEWRPAGSRGVILEVALQLFAERGFAGASIRDIAKASGVQSATLYSHYPSKEHVLAELCRIGHEEHLREVRSALLACQPDPRLQLGAYVQAHVHMHAAYSMLALVANAELHMLGQELGAASFELRRQSENLLVEIIKRGREMTLFRVDNDWLAAAAIGGMGLRVAYWFAPGLDVSETDVRRTYGEFALRIVGAAET